MDIHIFEDMPSLKMIEPLVDRTNVKVFRASHNKKSVLFKVHASEKSFIRETESMIRLNNKNAPVPKILESRKMDDHYAFLWIKGFIFAQTT